MKKLFIIPVLMMCMVGAAPKRIIEPTRKVFVKETINTKIDSADIKLKELTKLIQKL